MLDFIERIRKEWAVIGGAPWSFATAIGIVAVASWFIIGQMNSATLSWKNATIEAQKAQIDSYKDKLSGATPEEAKARIDELEARVAKVEHRPISPGSNESLGAINSKGVTFESNCIQDKEGSIRVEGSTDVRAMHNVIGSPNCGKLSVFPAPSGPPYLQPLRADRSRQRP